ncbi:MAG: alpha-amylase family glycosyl hydrolase [Oscillospiraceae bacterium]|nr:alpha-amylase family glycosyl hydrolase [Oscillospiraceae bacterium]
MDRFWYEDAVFYHIYTFSLAKAPLHNDYGTPEQKLPELKKWIPHIKKLGCNAVLLSPVLKSISHGYDVTDYFQIDNRLGTNEEFAALVKEYQKNGIRVVLDSVFNHCGRDFFAFKELQQGNRDYAEWFSGVDFNRKSPMGDYFDYDTWSGHYELVKFNHRSAQVRKHLLDAAMFWIDSFGIDGMRIDAANVLDFDFMRDLRQAVTVKKQDFWLMGEVVAGDYAMWANENTLHSVTNYMLYKSLFSSHKENNLFELAHSVQNAVPYNGLPLYTFLDNHDQPRIASNVDPAHLKTLYALLFTLPGIPSVYYGSEWAVTGVKQNNSDQPMRPYINIEEPPDDPFELAKYINLLAAIRSKSKALKYGGYRQLYLEYHRPYLFEREYDNEKVYVAVNISNDEQSVDLGCHAGGGFWDLANGEPVTHADNIVLKPHSARIIGSNPIIAHEKPVIMHEKKDPIIKNTAGGAKMNSGVQVLTETYKNFGKCIKLSNELCSVMVTVALGPRIISYSLHGKENVFYTDTERKLCQQGQGFDEYYYPGAKWYIYGGHRLWISPEAEVKSYYPDNDPVDYDIIPNGVRLNCAAQKGNDIQYTITMTLAPDSTEVTVSHEVKNVGGTTRSFAPWALSVMAPGGVGITPMPQTKTGLLANRVLALWDYSSMRDSRVFWGDKYITLAHDDKPPFKYGMLMADEWAAYLNSGQLFIKKFTTAPNGTYPDFGMSFESYTCAAFHEVESLGTLDEVKPGGSVIHTEHWELAEYTAPLDAKDESSIDALARKCIL